MTTVHAAPAQQHGTSAFNNACLRMPVRSSCDRRPMACFERPPSNIRFEADRPPFATVTKSQSRHRSRVRSASSNASSVDKLPTSRKTPASCSTKESMDEGGSEALSEKGVFCMSDFFESIPDYNDINHLSEHEFYGKLDGLKRKQAELNETCCLRRCPNGSPNDIPPILECTEPSSSTSANEMTSEANGAKGSRRRTVRSKSADSCHRVQMSPFQMTKRDEERNMLRELQLESLCAFRPDEPATHAATKSPNRKQAARKTHPIPCTSKYPMYDQIVADQEKRSQLVKLNSMLELQSKIKPFHFATDKPPPAFCDYVSDSAQHSPTLTGPFSFHRQSHSTKSKRFRARPCPRKLFSNYFYHRMWEEEQFRAVSRRLRADAILQQAVTPPSMRRHKQPVKDTFHAHCTESETAAPENPTPEPRSGRPRKRSGASRGRKTSSRTTATSSNTCGPNFVTTATQPFRFETSRRSVERRQAIAEAASSATESSAPATGRQWLRSTPVPVYPAARPNLAANLRAEMARKKLCELSQAATDADVGGQGGRDSVAAGGRRSWGVRRMPGWKSLYYDHTNDEDISLRLSTRRAEERLRHEEHLISMELMRQRVRATPLLLEGATQLPTTATAGRHRLHCERRPHGHTGCTPSHRSRSVGDTGHGGHGHGRWTAELTMGHADDSAGEDD